MRNCQMFCEIEKLGKENYQANSCLFEPVFELDKLMLFLSVCLKVKSD